MSMLWRYTSSTSPITQPARSVKIGSAGIPLASRCTLSMTARDVGNSVQAQQITTLPVVKVKNLWPHWVFPLGPSKIAPCILATIPLRGWSSSWIWQYQPNPIAQNLYWTTLPDKIWFGLNFDNSPPFTGNRFSCFVTNKTGWTSIQAGRELKGME